MNKKQIMVPLSIMFLLALALISITKAETRLVWGFDWEGIDVEIYAPYQAYPGDTITIRVRVEAKEDLQDIYVEVWMFGSKLQGYDTWTEYISVLYDVDLSTGVVRDEDFDVEIPSDVSPGLIYSHTYCNWKVYRWPTWSDRSLNDSFRVAYLKNKAYEDLQVAYSNLLDDYNTSIIEYGALNSSYYGLKSNYESLNSTYYNLLDIHNQLQSDYSSLQENYDALTANYITVQTLCNSLSTNYTSLQGDYDLVCSDYDTLEANYNSLNSTYNSLKSSYDSLQADYNDLETKYQVVGELGTTRNLMYLFVITTIVFIATTAYLAIRKPKVKSELKTT